MRTRLNTLFDALLPVIATLAALGVGAVMLLFLKVNPIAAYIRLIAAGRVWQRQRAG